MIIIFGFLEHGSWNIVMLFVYAGGSGALFLKASKENNYHKFHLHKLLVIEHSLMLWTSFILFFGRVILFF